MIQDETECGQNYLANEPLNWDPEHLYGVNRPFPEYSDLAQTWSRYERKALLQLIRVSVCINPECTP
jgi:hypothetical protein